MKVAYWSGGGSAQRDVVAVASDLARGSGSEITPVSLYEKAPQGLIGRGLLHLGLSSIMASETISPTGAYDVVVVPAVTAQGAGGYSESEIFPAANIGKTPILRVRRQPLGITQVLMLFDNTPTSRTLAQRYVRLGLWANALVVVLPMDRPSVALFVQDEVEMLRSCGRCVTVLPALDLNFERPDLESILRHFEAAVVAHLSHRVGLYFGAARNDPFAIIAERVPFVLLP